MTYENLVKEAKKAVKSIDVKAIKEHLAVEFDIEGKAEGAFYVEFTADKVEVEPYEYYDHDFRIRTDAASAVAILNGELDPTTVVEGDTAKAELLKKYCAKAEAAKTETKKAPAKKATATKTATKATTKKPAAKSTAKKPAATTKKAATKTTK